MACKTCDKRLEDLMKLEADRNQEKQRADFNKERAEELQEACNRYKDQLNSSQKEVESLWLALKDEMKKAPARELLRMASEAAQLVALLAKAFPGGSPVTDEASSVALGALKQVRERLQEGANDAGSRQEG